MTPSDTDKAIFAVLSLAEKTAAAYKALEARMTVLENALWYAGRWQGSGDSLKQYLADELKKLQP